MSNNKPTGVGIIGAGVISSQYLENLQQYPDIKLVAVCDSVCERARQQAEKYSIGYAASVSGLLARDDIEVVLNLTPPESHTGVGLEALAAGKHVWSEKPFALARAEGRRVLDAAAAARLRVSCAPDTFLGRGFQAAKRAVLSGQFGHPDKAFVRFESAGPQIWHPQPEFLFRRGAGPLFDMGPYYLTALVQLFGSVTSVNALASKLRSTRIIGQGPRAGTEFRVEVPTHVSALYEFADGQSAEASFSFDSQFRRFHFEVMCEDALLQLPDPNTFAGQFTICKGGGWNTVEAGEQAFGRGAGVVDLVRSLRDDTPEQASGALAYHVMDVMLATMEAATDRRRVLVESVAPVTGTLPENWSPFETYNAKN